MSLLDELIARVRNWASDRNLILGSNSEKQYLKLGSEMGELGDALLSGTTTERKDAIGDMTVVLIIMCDQLGYSFENCLALAYDEIKDRKGRMINGAFVKEENLPENQVGHHAE
jgi:NTP pyrophosphatase (non-canonical NTP hydrolase)